MVSISSSIQAIAIAGGISSALAVGSYIVPPPKLVFLMEPANTTAGTILTPAPAVAFEDASGRVIATASGPVTLQLGSNPGGGTLSGLTTVSAGNGVATFPGLTINNAGTGYTLAEVSAGVPRTASTPFNVAAPLAISITLASSSIYTGSAATGTLTLNLASSRARTVTITSSAPTMVSVAPATVTVAAGQTTGSFTYTGVAPGAAMLTAAGDGYSPASSAVTDLPPAIPASFFGMTVINVSQVTPTVSYGSTRSWDAVGLSWAELNTAPGVYNFAALDNFIAASQAHGAEMIYTFGRTPPWASSQPNAASPYALGECAPPANFAYWDAFVTAIVTHAAGRIKYWEIWNEPNDPQFWCGNAQTRANDLITLAKRAYSIIKRLQPRAAVLSPALAGPSGPSWLNWYLSLGGKNYLDVVAFHGYSSPRAEDILTVTANYRAVMATWGLAGAPMRDTEGSWSNTVSAVPIATQVGFIPKSYLLRQSLGLEAFNWYAWDGGPIWGGMWTSADGPSAAATSYAQTYQWMVGASMTAPCSEDQTSVWSCRLSRPDGYSAEALWISNSTATVTVPSQYVQFADLTGAVHPIVNNTVAVGDQPILVETGNIPH
jgi:hypothetical protein